MCETVMHAVHAEFDAGGTVDMSTIKPLVDGGTEGLRGHARVIYPGVSPCFECTLWLFPPQVRSLQFHVGLRDMTQL